MAWCRRGIRAGAHGTHLDWWIDPPVDAQEEQGCTHGFARYARKLAPVKATVGRE